MSQNGYSDKRRLQLWPVLRASSVRELCDLLDEEYNRGLGPPRDIRERAGQRASVERLSDIDCRSEQGEKSSAPAGAGTPPERGRHRVTGADK